MDRLVQLYTSLTGKEPGKCEKIAGGGSNRDYYRLTSWDSDETIIGAIGTSLEENNAFIALSKHFTSLSLPVPEVYAVSDDGMAYLQTDLGQTSLYNEIREGRENAKGYSDREISLLEETMRLLPKLQVIGGRGLDFTLCYPQASLNEQNVLFDLNYFKYCFLKTTDVDFNEMKLEECFQSMARELGKESPQYFMYRDFQARNVMIDAMGKPNFIDFQGGRRGPLQYDLVSFLWQASSHFDSCLREHLIDVYLDSLKEYADVDRAEFKASIPQWVLFRTLQVLGAYGFRGRFERKKYFLDSIPSAIENLREVLECREACPYPYLYEVLKQMVNCSEFKRNNGIMPSVSKYENKGQLKVRVFSFSYKKGIPEDSSGNGGGYVFDCRSTHNPGRYEPYKKLTGLDKPVVDFLEEDGEILDFLQDAYSLADRHVERYMQRGFTSLMFCFGCTGGQHRSVYSAEHLGRHINEKYGLEVEISHREQCISYTLPSKRKAMIFAAGLGTRLKPLTDHMPKALVEVDGKPLIEHVLEKLVLAGFNDIIVNVHHFANLMQDWRKYVADVDRFKDIKIGFSDESAGLLETGGGIVHAGNLLVECNPDNKVLIHNVDILSDVDLSRLYHEQDEDADVVLVVSKRDTARYFVFDDDMRLVGWVNIKTGEIKSPFENVHKVLRYRDVKSLDFDGYHLRAFAGIHVIKTGIVGMMAGWPEKFSITDFYIKSCKDIVIKAYIQEGLKIMDVGKIDSLAEADEFVRVI